MTPLSDRLRAIRAQRRMTQQDLASRAKVATGTISRLERGLGNPRQHTLERIASALNIDLGALYGAKQK